MANLDLYSVRVIELWNVNATLHSAPVDDDSLWIYFRTALIRAHSSFVSLDAVHSFDSFLLFCHALHASFLPRKTIFILCDVHTAYKRLNDGMA